jgi:amino acid transporter
MTWTVASVSLDLSVLSFLFFVILTVLSLRKSKTHAAAHVPADLKLQAGLADVAKLVEGLAKLTDSLTKAGPAIASLVASIIFMLLAFSAPR